MKKIIISFTVIVLFCLSACTPDNPSMGFENIADDPRIKVFDMAGDNSYMLVNGMQGEILPPKWDLGNGQTAVGDTVYVGYAFVGSYTVTMIGFDGEKEFSVTKTIRTTQDNMALVSDPVYKFLTGGVDAVNGKTWVIDSLRTGHISLIKRQTGQESSDLKVPLYYAGTGMYDDEITFKLMGSECRYENHGQSYSHGGTIDGIPFYRINQLKQMGTVIGEPIASPKGDYIVNYTPGISPQKWALIKRNETVSGVTKDVYYLQLTGGAYMFFYRGNQPSDIEYKIDSIGENYLRVIHYETYPASRATAKWEDRYLLVPKGYPIQPETPVVPEPPKEDNINENFEGASQSFTLTSVNTVQWMGLPSYSVVDNVSMTGINPSNKIARFVRGGGSDEQLKVVRNNTIKLTDKNKLKMMVYMPSTNNYLNVNLKPTVEVRLTNSKNTTQVAVQTATVASTNFDKWIELTFDFSSSASITTFDTWIIQFGGQYPNGTSSSQGIFYFDNIKLQN